MKPYYKFIFKTDTDEKVTVNVPNGKQLDESLRDTIISSAVSDILTGNAIKTNDDSNLVSAEQVFYCTTEEISFNVGY